MMQFFLFCIIFYYSYYIQNCEYRENLFFENTFGWFRDWNKIGKICLKMWTELNIIGKSKTKNEKIKIKLKLKKPSKHVFKK